MLLGTLNLLTARHDEDPHTERVAQGMVWDLLIGAFEAQHRATDEPDALLLRRMGDWVRGRAKIGGGSTRELARAFALSERSLYRFFARQGTTPDRWMWQQRLELAREYLRAPRATVSGVAMQVGFKDLSHFSRSFRRAFGLPPSAYRRQVQTLS
jgi:transcriptional regulator GlxA family with amidase domain